MRQLAIALLLALSQQATTPVDVQLQQIVATVRDDSGSLIRNLRAEDFILEDDGTPQVVRYCIEDTDVPVSLGILIDQSASIGSQLSVAVSATRMLLRLMKPGDEFLLMSFADGPAVRQPFTEDVFRIEESLLRMKTGGGTDLVAGVVNALREVKKSKYRKRALIVFTDAESAGNLTKLTESIYDAEVSVHTFVLQNALQGRVGFGFSENLNALESGGRSFIVDLKSENPIPQMISFIQEIAVELRGQYTLSFYPAKPGPIESRVIRLRTNRPGARARVLRQLPQSTN